MTSAINFYRSEMLKLEFAGPFGFTTSKSCNDDILDSIQPFLGLRGIGEKDSDRIAFIVLELLHNHMAYDPEGYEAHSAISIELDPQRQGAVIIKSKGACLAGQYDAMEQRVQSAHRSDEELKLLIDDRRRNYTPDEASYAGGSKGSGLGIMCMVFESGATLSLVRGVDIDDRGVFEFTLEIPVRLSDPVNPSLITACKPMTGGAQSQAPAVS